MRTLLLLLMPFCLTGQKETARLEVEQIHRAYTRMTRLHMEVDYVMYATHTGTKPIDTQRGKLSREGLAWLYKLGPTETLTTAQFTIYADHEDRELVLDRVRGKGPQQEQFGVNLQMALDACSAVRVTDPAAGVRVLQLDLPETDVERLELRYDAKSKKMQKVTLFYRDAEEWEEEQPASKARMEIIYRQQDTQPKYAPNLFSPERFVRKTGNGYTPAPAFNDYSLYDQTQY